MCLLARVISISCYHNFFFLNSRIHTSLHPRKIINYRLDENPQHGFLVGPLCPYSPSSLSLPVSLSLCVCVLTTSGIHSNKTEKMNNKQIENKMNKMDIEREQNTKLKQYIKCCFFTKPCIWFFCQVDIVFVS